MYSRVDPTGILIDGRSALPKSSQYDAIVIGSGPNGLAAAVTLAEEGCRVLVVEAHQCPGGGARSSELTLPGFVHDVCSAVHPMAVCSEFFRRFPLEECGLTWIYPPASLAHPLDGAEPALLYPSIEATARGLGKDGQRYRSLVEPLIRDGGELFRRLVGPPAVPPPSLWPRMVRLGMRVLPSVLFLARRWFREEPARALLGGNAAHAILPLDRIVSTGAIGLMLMLANHLRGWPIPRGGSGEITRAMVHRFERCGGEIVCGQRVESLRELPGTRALFFDTTPAAMAELAADRLPGGYRRRLQRFRHGPGIFKVDYALSEPVPWLAPVCRDAGTVHVGGRLEEIARAGGEVWRGKHPESPFVLAAQPSLFDETRAPSGSHTFWAYTHVPAGSTVDRTDAIERQLERFAPGFRDCVLARHTMNCADLEAYNPNLVGGDIAGGVTDWRQLLTRPVVSLKPHATPDPDIFLCSASTPPGAGVHGMGGYAAAREWLRRVERRR